MAVRISDPVARFWAKVEKTDGCWLWRGSLRQEYGQFYLDPSHRDQSGRKLGQAHRFSWELHFGPIPDGLWVLHRCDNPPCVRPDHLWLGTAADNNADAGRKGRNAMQRYPDRNPSHLNPAIQSRPGEKNGRAKLTAEQVQRIRERAQHETKTALAKEFGLGWTTVAEIISRKRWRHV